MDFTIELPDRVSAITFSDITSTSVNISWTDNAAKKQPFNYIIEYFGCCKSNVFPIETKKTSIIIEHLDPSTLYNIGVAVSNGITALTGKFLYEKAELQTEIEGSKDSC